MSIMVLMVIVVEKLIKQVMVEVAVVKFVTLRAVVEKEEVVEKQEVYM